MTVVTDRCKRPGCPDPLPPRGKRRGPNRKWHPECKRAVEREKLVQGAKAMKRRRREPLPDGTAARPFPTDPAAYDLSTARGQPLTRQLFKLAARTF